MARACCVLVFVFAVSCRAFGLLSNDWNGTWKLDPAKSHIYGPTLRISRTSDGVYHNSGRIGTASFDCDGKGHRVSESLTVSCVQTGSDYLEISAFKNGSKVSTAHWELSNHENALTIQGTMLQSNGSAKSIDIHHFTRTSGSTGFVGGWRNAEPFEGLASILQTKVGNDALQFSYPEKDIHVNAPTDGNNAAVHTFLFPSDATIALTERGPRTLSLTTKVNGQIAYVEYWQMSADGRSLTQSSWFANRPNEKYVLVYKKQ
ncbi:MAG TPA: hypothetical protein VHZ09_05060 [Acidobacteriaceae bacterium]|jgi:hypothetical protein|nr:hypothetical protein [Acidobacteriaceae bacterium]